MKPLVKTILQAIGFVMAFGVLFLLLPLLMMPLPALAGTSPYPVFAGPLYYYRLSLHDDLFMMALVNTMCILLGTAALVAAVTGGGYALIRKQFPPTAYGIVVAGLCIIPVFICSLATGYLPVCFGLDLAVIGALGVGFWFWAARKIVGAVQRRRKSV